MAIKTKLESALIISKKRKADFFSSLEQYMSEYKRKYLSDQKNKPAPAVKVS